MKTLFLTILLLLLFPLPSWGADGDTCTAHVLGASTGTITKITKGIWREIACIQLCDGKKVADNSNGCTEFNMSAVTGTPDLIVLEYEEDGDSSCSAGPIFTVSTGPISGGTPTYDIDSTAVTIGEATTRVVIDMSTAPVDNFLFITNGATLTGCDQEGVDVRMHLLTRDMF